MQSKYEKPLELEKSNFSTINKKDLKEGSLSKEAASSTREMVEDNMEAVEYEKYQQEVRALETSYFKELMEDCKKDDACKPVRANKVEKNPPERALNEIIRTAKENVENKVNHLNEIEIVRTDLGSQAKTGTQLKAEHLDRTMLNDVESAVYVLQGKDFTKMSHINDDVYVKINGQYVKAADKSNTKDTNAASSQQMKSIIKPSCPNPNDVLKQLKSIVDQSVAHVELYSATLQTCSPNHPTSRLLEHYNQQLQLYNQKLPIQTADSQVLKSQCNNSNTTNNVSNTLRKMTEISVEMSTEKSNNSHCANPGRLEEDAESLDVTEINLLKNLTQEEIAWFSRCNFCSKSLNMSSMGELLVHCRECSALDRSQGRFTYMCYVCGVYNSNKSTNMKKHLLTHLGHKAFACDSCQYTCVTRSDLQRHLRKHTGEKPYACHMCEYRSSRTETLKKHMLNIHKIVHANYSLPELNVYNALLSGDMRVINAHDFL